MSFAKPDNDALNGMLAMIAGDDAKAKPSDKKELADRKFQGLFEDDDGKLVACCSCDMATGVALGCALSMIPPGGAEAMVEDGEISEGAAENLYEVMNILSSLFMDNTTPHLKLTEVLHADYKEVPANNVCSFDLDLGKYGNGELLFEAA